MDTCSEHGDCVVVYRGRTCPVCDLINDYRLTILELKSECAGIAAEQIKAVDRVAELETVFSDYPELEAVVALRR